MNVEYSRPAAQEFCLICLVLRIFPVNLVYSCSIMWHLVELIFKGPLAIIAHFLVVFKIIGWDIFIKIYQITLKYSYLYEEYCFSLQKENSLYEHSMCEHSTSEHSMGEYDPHFLEQGEYWEYWNLRVNSSLKIFNSNKLIALCAFITEISSCESMYFFTLNLLIINPNYVYKIKNPQKQSFSCKFLM